MSDELDEGPDRVPGKWVLLVLAALGVATVVLAVTLVRPVPGSRPAAPQDRAFGPASSGEQRDIPLIRRESPESVNGN